MKKVSFLALFFAITLLAGVVFAAGGDSSDPLISLSYLQGTFRDKVDKSVDSKLDTSDKAAYAQAESALRATIAAAEANAGGNVADTFTEKRLRQGDILSGATGLQAVVLAGNVNVQFSSGAVVDVTTGSEVQSGAALTANHRYLVAEDTSAQFTVAGKTAVVMYCGPYAIVTSSAVDYPAMASSLKTLGLFRGSDTAYGEGFDLEKAPTRMEALIMLIRLLGEEKEALACTAPFPFTDIPDWELSGVELFFDRSETFYIKNTDGHTVEVNGVPLDDSHVIQIATTAAAERLPIGITGVSICTQEISDLMATPTVTIFDESGKAMEVSYDAETHTFTEQTQANTISDDEKEAALNAAKTYCLFMIEKASRADIAKYFDTSSEAYSVITNLSGNLWMQGNNGYRFTKEEVSDYARYSDDLFSARVALTLNVTRTDGTTKDYDYDQTLFFRKQDTGKWLAYEATNADVNAPVGKVRLTFMNGDTVLSSDFIKTDATELDTPLVSAPEGKVFIGWYRIDKYDNGTTYTMVFDPDENGHVTIPNGTTLEPMTLYALFETPSGTDATEGG